MTETEPGLPKQRPRLVILTAGVLALVILGWWTATHLNLNPRYKVGQEIDRLNGVAVFFNGGVEHGAGRSLAADGYNIGIKYQCVEFVKRYYYERLKHKMPDAYGHAKQFFDPALADGVLNTRRDLLQYRNDGSSKPQPEDIVVFGPWLLNRYGHVAIVAQVTDLEIEVIQQNPGPFGSSRERFGLVQEAGHWRCTNPRALGWLRKAAKTPEQTAATGPY